MLRRVIPVLHVRSSLAAEEFYCRRPGFEKEFANRPDAALMDGNGPAPLMVGPHETMRAGGP